MKKVRFEIKLSTCRDGRTLARIYDDYWDSMDIDLFDPAHPEQVDLKAFKELAAQLANRKPGWYAIEVEDYPFGKAARLFRIPWPASAICPSPRAQLLNQRPPGGYEQDRPQQPWCFGRVAISPRKSDK